MVRPSQIWFRGAIALVVVWSLAGASIWWIRSQRMTAEKTLEYVRSHPLTELSEAERKEVIAEVIQRINRLSFEERQRLRHDGGLRRWLQQLDETERQEYLERTLPKGLQEMMTAFNKMPAQRRKRIVSRALADLEQYRNEVESPELQFALSDPAVQCMVEEGLKSLYGDASADAKLDLQPLIEQIQKIMQSGR